MTEPETFATAAPVAPTSVAGPLGTGTVSVQANLQKAQPSIPLASAFPRHDLGDSGTRILHGIIQEEYNPQLNGIEGIRIYDTMRRNDGTVRAAMMVTTLPVRRAEWFVKPVGDDPDELETLPRNSEGQTRNEEIAEFVRKALFEMMDITWDDFVRQALLMVPFGVMLFEKVYGVKEWDGKSWVCIEKMAPRLPKSILQWELSDKTFGIQQIRQDGVLAMIPGSKLLIFVNEREGDNWWGMSMLRAAYKHWYMKDKFYNIEALAFERQGMGIPVMNMPVGYTEADEKRAKTAMKNLRSGEEAFLILPDGYKAEFMNMGSATTLSPDKAIEHHNKEILQSVLAQFLELGATKAGSGSRALSTDHSDLFLKAMETIAFTFISVVNKDLVKELVDMNFNDVDDYPVVDYSGISKVDITAMGTAIAQMVAAGALTMTDDDQQWIRAAIGLPPRSQADIDAANEDKDTEDLEEGLSLTPEDVEEDDESDAPDGDATPTVDSASKKTDAPEAPKKTTPLASNLAKAKKARAKAAATKKAKAGTTAPKKKASDLGLAIPRKFDDGSGFMSWRPLTFAEKKVNWQSMEDFMNTLEASFSKEAIAQLTKSKDAFMTKLHKLITDNDQKGIETLEMAFVAQYEAVVEDAMLKAYQYGKESVASEMGVAIPPNTADTLANISVMANTIAKKTVAELEGHAKLGAASALQNDTPALQASGSIDAMLDEKIAKHVDDTANMLVGQNINMGRNDVFERNLDEIYALQRSELLDAKTCNYCLSADGRVVEATDPVANATTYHSNCRGIWVQILKDEVNPPAITGMPQDVQDLFGGQTNDLIQPKNPIVDEGSAAAKEVARRDALKKK